MNRDESILHYEWVLNEADAKKIALQAQIADLQRQARELSVTIGGILKLAPASVVARYSSGQLLSRSRGVAAGAPPESQRYTALSTRWAILLALSEAKSLLSIPELAEELKSGGFSSDAKNFNNNVSSVLSRMQSTKAEVDVLEGRWFITEVGRSAIAYIKAQKLRRRLSRMTETPEAGGTASGESKGDS